MDYPTRKKELLERVDELGKLTANIPENENISLLEKRHFAEMIICIDRIYAAIKRLEVEHNKWLAKWN